MANTISLEKLNQLRNKNLISQTTLSRSPEYEDPDTWVPDGTLIEDSPEAFGLSLADDAPTIDEQISADAPPLPEGGEGFPLDPDTPEPLDPPPSLYDPNNPTGLIEDPPAAFGLDETGQPVGDPAQEAMFQQPLPADRIADPALMAQNLTPPLNPPVSYPDPASQPQAPIQGAPLPPTALALPEQPVPELLPPPVQETYPGYQNEIDARELQRPVISDQTELAEQEAGFKQSAADAYAGLSTERVAQLEKVIADRDAAVNTAVEEMKAEYETYKKMKIKDYWADKSTSSRMIMAIGIGLGSFRPGNNSGKYLSDLMQLDYKKQKQNIDNQFRTVKLSKGNVDQVRTQHADKIKSLDLMHLAKLEKVKALLNQKIASIGTPKAQVAGQALMAKLDLEIGKAKDKSFRDIQDQITKRLKATPKEKTWTPFQKWTKKRDEEKRTVPQYGQTRTVKEAIDFRRETADVNSSIQAIDRIKSLGSGIMKVSRGRLAKMETEMIALIGKMRISLAGPGPLTADERAMMRSAIGDPSQFFSFEGIQTGKLDTLRHIITKNHENNAAQVIMGYKPFDRQGGLGGGQKELSLKDLSPQDQIYYKGAENLLKSNPTEKQAKAAFKTLELIKQKYQGGR